MSDSVRSPYPKDVDIPVQFAGWFTIRDILRLAVPAGAGFLYAGILGLVVGGGLGTLGVFWKPWGKKLDVHAANALEYLVETQTGAWLGTVTFRDNVAICRDGTACGVVRVKSCDIELLSESEQRANQDIITDLLKTADFPFEIHSRQRNTDLSKYETQEDSTITTDHFVFTYVSKKHGALNQDAKSDTDAIANRADEVLNRCKTIRDELTGADMTAEVMSKSELHEELSNHHYWELNPSWRSYRTKSEHRPDDHRRMVYVTEYPRQLQVGWLADVLNSEGRINAIQTVSPSSTKDQRKLSRILSRLKAEQASSSNPQHTTKVEQALADAEDMMDAQVGGEPLVWYGVYLVARGESKSQADETLERVKATLRSHRIQFQEPVFETVKAARTDTGLFKTELDKNLLVPGVSASGGFSFSTHDTIDERGIVFGTDTRNNAPVILDRFAWDAPHIVRMGQTGSGKTVGTIVELLRAQQAYSDLKIRIVDPKPDYGVLVDALDGETYVIDDQDLDKTEPGAVARYVVKDPSNSNTEQLSKAVRHIHRESCETSGKTLVVVDEAHRILADADGAAALSTLVREGRSRRVAVSILTQNSDVLTSSQMGKNILQNTGCFIFMRHNDVEHSAIDFFNLSESESIQLRKLRTGSDTPFSEAILRGPVNTKVRIYLSEGERNIVLPAENDSR